MSLRPSWLKRLSNARRFERFKRLIASRPQGRLPEERLLSFQPPVAAAPHRELCVSSADYRALLIEERRQDHKMSALIEACVEGSYTLLFDVGANYGEFVASAIGSVPSVVAVEANPIVARCLKQSFEGEEGVRVLAHAVSDQEATLTMRINPQYSGGNRLVTGESAPTPYFLEGCVFALDVPCRRLSDVLREERGEHTRVAMKMDVEGHEPVLLAELLGWLEEQSARGEPLEALLVMFEFNSNSYEERKRLTELLRGFTALGAQLSHLAERKQESAGRVLIEAQGEEQALERPGEIFIELRSSSDA